MAKATLWGPLKNSLVCGFFTVLVSVPLGSVLGWLIARTDIPGKKLLGMLVVIPYMIPSWCKSLSWLAVFRNKTSGSLGFLEGLGIPIPDWLAYGPVAIVLCMSLHYYAFSYIHVQSALRSINSELEEMGEICGASKPQILKSITIPLVLPSVLSAVVMTLSKSIGTYGVAANLGNRIGYFTLATKMKNFINGSPQNVGHLCQPAHHRRSQKLRHHRRQGRAQYRNAPRQGQGSSDDLPAAVSVLRDGYADVRADHGDLPDQHRRGLRPEQSDHVQLDRLQRGAGALLHQLQSSPLSSPPSAASFWATSPPAAAASGMAI